MTQSAQDSKKTQSFGFTSVQAYSLAVITLVIGIAVGYFARGSAPARQHRKPHSRPPLLPLEWAADNRAWARDSFPASAPSNRAQRRRKCWPRRAAPLLEKLKSNPKDFETLRQLGEHLLRRSGVHPGHRLLRQGAGSRPQELRCSHRLRYRLLVHRQCRQGH